MFRKIILKRNNSNHKEEGQSLVEYGLILALVSVVAILVLILLGNNVNNILNNVHVSTTP